MHNLNYFIAHITEVDDKSKPLERTIKDIKQISTIYIHSYASAKYHHELQSKNITYQGQQVKSDGLCISCEG